MGYTRAAHGRAVPLEGLIHARNLCPSRKTTLHSRIPLSCALALALAGCAGGGPGGTGYATDAGTSVVMSGYNLCWRTSYWTPALANGDCDPDLVPKPKPTAAPVRQPAPAAAAGAPPTPIPAPAVPTPAPKPAVTAAAPPPKPKRCDATVTLQSDQTFGFNSATLTPAARARIDSDVLPRLQNCSSLELIAVSGHTDRIGSQQFNQKLSKQRADVVKQYLVAKGVSDAKIDTVGMGKTMPVKFCPDTRNQKELIACLAANRRVEIAIKGPGK